MKNRLRDDTSRFVANWSYFEVVLASHFETLVLEIRQSGSTNRGSFYNQFQLFLLGGSIRCFLPRPVSLCYL